MKKKILTLFIISSLAAGMVACGGKEAEQEPESPVVENTTQSETPEAETESTDELSADDKAAAFKDYTDGLNKIGGKNFKVYAGLDKDNGICSTVETEDGVLYWQYANDNNNLVTVEYASGNNNLNINSWDVSAEGKVEIVSSINIEEFIPISDDLTILFSGLSLSDKKDVMMIESRGLAYSYADGVDYNITLIEIKEDGSLDKFFDEGVAGSGDEDITSGVREKFNKTTGSEYSQDTFEDIFYNGKLFIEQENKPILASIKFKSESGKLADNGDWDGANEITSKIYALMDTPGDPVYWGEGQFAAEN
ncbi:hypothetical protein SAMN02910298_02269 [Pseudobutyrivibrio sp. YE44]|uniref:hypothetical protein n=1 Tax=Pseudobutyrivibrio sp. YE44 TaxID=1520802 RepID=UPI0008818EE5|nr:hypothetical protein [Pseudobutyrivibrio sp. YE44]SDB45298.1 hypothetical protein SAMN02910298_02269 [Pseudobutyrivibrio sp. YE44]